MKRRRRRRRWWNRDRPRASKRKGKGSCLESRLHDNACSTDFTFALARWAPMQPATINPTLDLCTRYPLWLGGPRQCGIRSLPDTSTCGQHWESTPDLLILSAMPYPLGRMLPYRFDLTSWTDEFIIYYTKKHLKDRVKNVSIQNKMPGPCYTMAGNTPIHLKLHQLHGVKRGEKSRNSAHNTSNSDWHSL